MDNIPMLHIIVNVTWGLGIRKEREHRNFTHTEFTTQKDV